MTSITFKGSRITTIGELPEINTMAPDFTLTKTDLSDATLKDFSGKTIVLNIFPSIDTPVCAASVRKFNDEASRFDNTVVLCISADLPFAHQRFCEVEGLKDVIPLSVFRSQEFGTNYGVTITDSPLKGLMSRAIVVIDKTGNVVYKQQAPEIAQEPNYDEALKAISEIT
jgi:thiol peroxidase